MRMASTSASGGRLASHVGDGRGRALDRPGQLRVHEQRHAESLEDRHCALEIALGDVLELVDTRGHEEALEPAHAGRGERLELACVPRHHAAPELHAHRALPACGLALRRERRGGRGRGDAVERHVDERRHAARERGACRGGETLPLCSARLVHVNVGVDEPRQQRPHAQLDAVDAGRSRIAHGIDPPLPHDHPRVGDAGRRHDGRGMEGECGGGGG
jgi:hypothetical protein